MRITGLVILGFFTFAIGSLCQAAPSPPDAVYSSPQSAESARAMLRNDYAKFQNNDFRGAADGLTALIHSPGFALLNDQEQHAGYYLLGVADMENGDNASGLKMLQIATRSSDAVGVEWHARLIAAFALHDYNDCIESLTTIAQKWPSSLSQLNDQAIFLIARKASEKSDAAAVALLEPIHQFHWTPLDRFSKPDRLWLTLAKAYANLSDETHEIAALNDVHDGGLLIYVSGDKRFDGAVRANPSHYDVRAAIEAEVQETRRLMQENPDRLEAVHSIADVLIKTGHAAEALALLDEALARNKSDAKSFSDQADFLNWIYNDRTRALTLVGRHEEALEQLVLAARIPEKGLANVSQVINLADAYNSEARPRDALNAILGLEMANPSPYGLMALEHARGCAYAQLHDEVNLKKSLDYLAAHASDGRGPLLETLLCANDLDGAAKLIISELKEPSSRGDTLYTLQDYQDDLKATAIEKENRQRLLSVRNRPDVASAISAVGRVEAYPVLPPNT